MSETGTNATYYHPARRRSDGVAARGARAANGDAGATGLAGPRLTVLCRVSASLKCNWLRRGPGLLSARLVLYSAPASFYWRVELAARGWRIETAVSTRSRRWRTDDESVCVAGRWDAAPDDDTI